MQIKTYQGGFDKNLCYLVFCETTRRAAIIDPSVESVPVIEDIENEKLIIEKIILTHTHFDHLAFMDDYLYQFPNIIIGGHSQPVRDAMPAYKGYSHREVFTIGSHMFTILHTPGHYPDCICIWNEKEGVLFTGDTMFIGRTGRTISPGSSILDLYHSVYNILLNLPEETIVYPGHHYGFSTSCTLNDNRKYSPFFQCRSSSEFITVMDNFERSRR